jgi:tRNA A37 N6-isopentenylltransferase MiaA
VALTVENAEDKEAMVQKLYTGERSGGLESLGYDVRCFFLCPDDRMGLTRVIDTRCEQMLVRGLLKETAGTHFEKCLLFILGSNISAKTSPFSTTQT